MVGDRDITVLLAKLFAEQMIASKEHCLDDNLPQNIPDLMLSYLNELNRTIAVARLDLSRALNRPQLTKPTVSRITDHLRTIEVRKRDLSPLGVRPLISVASSALPTPTPHSPLRTPTSLDPIPRAG